MSTVIEQQIANIQREAVLLKNSVPPMARNLPAFKKADDLLIKLIEITKNQSVINADLKDTIEGLEASLSDELYRRD